MTELQANGIFMGLKMEVKAKLEGEDLKVTFDGEENKPLRKYLIKLLNEKRIVAGTYQPEKAFSSINLFFTLQDRFFDNKATVKLVSGEMDEIPDEGKVY